MAKILVTGFGPFPGAPENPTAKLVARLARIRRPAWSDHGIVAHVFPTSYAAVAHDLPKLIARHRPEAVVMFGLAARTRYLRVETQATNRVSLLHPDIARHVPCARAIRARGSHHLRTRAFAPRLVAAARAAGADARVSRNAGSYICNYAYWLALEAATEPRGPQSGPKFAVFIHVPKLRSARRRAGRPRPPAFETLLRAAQAMITAAIAGQRRR